MAVPVFRRSLLGVRRPPARRPVLGEYCKAQGRHAFLAYVAVGGVWQRWCAVCGISEIGEQLSLLERRGAGSRAS